MVSGGERWTRTGLPLLEQAVIGGRIMSDDLELQPSDEELPLDAVGRESPGNERPPESQYFASVDERNPPPPHAVPKVEPGN
jgi:hypothetical protein